MVKQVGLLPAGCQPWNHEVCAASGNRFAYCATLAIYVYQLDPEYNKFKLLSILSAHKKTISAISWHPQKEDIFASASYENRIIVWDVAQQKPLATFDNTKTPPIGIDWCLLQGDAISFVDGRGPLHIWNYKMQNPMVSAVKDTSGFSSEVVCFKWHPKRFEMVAFGHKDGSISFCTMGSRSHRHQLKPEYEDDYDESCLDNIVALAWDPLSTDYLLTSNAHSGIRLLDSASLTVIMRFNLPSAATKVKTITWVVSAPGMFITGDALSGNLRVWNVSKSTPVENIRVKKTGFHALCLICDGRQQHSRKQMTLNQSSQASSTSLAQNPTAVNAAHFALPPARAVCTFLDGGVGLYDLGRRKWEFLRDQGHIETIFDCEFCPENGNILATGSFDGTVKIWDVVTFTCLNTSPGNEGIIYSISWAPADINCIVAGTSKKGMFLWDINKGRIVKRFNEHGKSSVYTVVWSKKDSRVIMSCGGDGYCFDGNNHCSDLIEDSIQDHSPSTGDSSGKAVSPLQSRPRNSLVMAPRQFLIIRQVDGEVLHKYKHPGAVYGCDWCPHNKDMLATGCEDKNVRIYYTATNSETPLKVLSGHTAKVFHVKWSPLKENLLISGSDDSTIRVWDYNQDACITVLSGHKGPVRGLMWNTEIPFLIVSGSWDSTICTWDIRIGSCLHSMQDHGADVYGLTSHPSRPFILASTSRDSTVRLWSITSLVQPLEMLILCGKPWSDIIGTTEGAMAEGSEMVLTGRFSRNLKLQAEQHPAHTRNTTIKLFSKLFMSPAYSDNFWELVAVVNGLDDSLLSPSYSKGIMHVKHVVKYCNSDAQQLEMAKLTKFGGGIGARSKEDRLKDAAHLHMKSGNMQRYCELTLELGHWERALALAPAVSYSYWKKLTKRYSQYLIQEGKDDASIFCTATGDTDALVDLYHSRGEMSDAVLCAQVACEGLAPGNNGEENRLKGRDQLEMNDDNTERQLLEKSITKWSQWHMSIGSPIAAACCHLANDDTQGAMCQLIQGNELELAVAMGMTLNKIDPLTSVAIEMLSRRCERIGKWHLAVDLLHLIPDCDILVAKCCARCSAPKQQLDTLYKMANLPSVDECITEAEKLKRLNNVYECVMYYLLSSSPELGLELGLQHVKKSLQDPNWTVDDVFPLLQLLGCVRTEVLQVHRKRTELFALCSYIGGLVAIRRQYNSIVHSLFQHARTILQTEGYVDIGVTDAQINSEMTAWQSVHTAQPQLPVNVDIIPTEYRPTFIKLQTHMGTETNLALVGETRVAATHLPSHSDVHISCLTNQRIQGMAYFLEDGHSAVSHNEALMWAKVNPFSPLSTGYRMNPF